MKAKKKSDKGEREQMNEADDDGIMRGRSDLPEPEELNEVSQKQVPLSSLISLLFLSAPPLPSFPLPFPSLLSTPLFSDYTGLIDSNILVFLVLTGHAKRFCQTSYNSNSMLFIFIFYFNFVYLFVF